jgi:hypothetical protein
VEANQKECAQARNLVSEREAEIQEAETALQQVAEFNRKEINCGPLHRPILRLIDFSFRITALLTRAPRCIPTVSGDHAEKLGAISLFCPKARIAIVNKNVTTR